MIGRKFEGEVRRDTADGERVRVLGIDLAVNEAISQVEPANGKSETNKFTFCFHSITRLRLE